METKENQAVFTAHYLEYKTDALDHSNQILMNSKY